MCQAAGSKTAGLVLGDATAARVSALLTPCCLAPCEPMQAPQSTKERLAMLKQGLNVSMANVKSSMSSANSCSDEAAAMMAKKVTLSG